MDVAIHKNLDELVALALKDADAVRAEVEGSIANSTRLSLILMVVGFIVSGALAVFLSLAMTRPLVAPCRDHAKLSEGQLEVEVTDKARKDEIGRMANALEVFRVELARGAPPGGAEQAARAAMPPRSAARCSSGFAGRFQTQVAGIVDRVIETVSGVERSADAR